MIPDSSEIIKFDEEGNVGLKTRAFAGLRRFLDSRMFLVVLLILTSVGSFELGLLANIAKQREPITITEPTEAKTPDVGSTEHRVLEAASPNAEQGSRAANSAGGGLVASKTGTKYYYPWCGTASKISEKNKIYFASIADARSKGYTPAANCKGLE